MGIQPWFKMYAGDTLLDDDLFQLDPAAESLFLRMLCLCWRDGYCPSDPEEIALKIRRKQLHVQTHLQTVMQFFYTDAEGRLVSARMEAERNHSSNVSSERSEAAKAMHRKRKAELEQLEADAIAHANASAKSMQSESESDKRINTPACAVDDVKLEQAKPRKAKMQELDNHPAELHEAISIWRGLLKAMRNPELLDSFPVEKRYLPAAVGTVEATWRAWKKHRASMVQGHPVTDADILASVKMWASVKMGRATDRENPVLAAPMLPTMINHPDFVDALIRSVKARIAMESEVAHVA